MCDQCRGVYRCLHWCRDELGRESGERDERVKYDRWEWRVMGVMKENE